MAFGVMLATGCSGGCGAAEEPAAPPATPDPAVDPEPPIEPAPVDPGPPPVVTLRATPDRDRQVPLVVESRGDGPARLARAVVVERAGADGWSPVEGVAVRLMTSCEDRSDECLTLAPGAELHPPPWNGMAGDSQCDCERCVPVEAGRYRFVVTSCGGAHRVAGEPFELP